MLHYRLMRFQDLVKHLPVDLGQGTYRHTTKAKLIAYRLAGTGNGKRALDLGCGDGFWSAKLRERGWDVTAANYQDTRCPGVMEVNVELPLPFPSNSFDLVWMVEVLEHVQNIPNCTREVRRVLRPNGRIILTTPNSAFWLYRVLQLFGITPAQIQNPDHKQFFSLRDIRALFPEADIYGFFPYAVLKFTIRRGIGRLSPTFVVIDRAPRAAASQRPSLDETDQEAHASMRAPA
ncbi:MAG: hypothetical protein G01um101438_553 [Parcubacteria group bacterium Gr01-1014_38]|nr:MAG: hypothetical protein G01um101438_553 [Parcubacteria group bacterium Gr01-1014_38]